MSRYRSEAGRLELEALYDVAVDRLGVGAEERWVETSHGSTHVLAVGPADGPPVVVFHGGNATNPTTLAWYTDLADEYRLIAPDTVGQPGKSAETRVDPRGDGYGEWVVDLLDALGIESAPAIGTSYGGGIVLRTAALAPGRLDRAALVVPAGFGTGPIASAIAVGLPAVLYRVVPHEWLLDRALARLATRPDPVTRATVAASLRHVRLEREFPGADAAELADFASPIALFVAEDDPFFPPGTVVPRARERLPSLSRVEVLTGERHLLSSDAQRRVAASIREFFEE